MMHTVSTDILLYMFVTGVFENYNQVKTVFVSSIIITGFFQRYSQVKIILFYLVITRLVHNYNENNFSIVNQDNIIINNYINISIIINQSHISMVE